MPRSFAKTGGSRSVNPREYGAISREVAERAARSAIRGVENRFGYTGLSFKIVKEGTLYVPIIFDIYGEARYGFNPCTWAEKFLGRAIAANKAAWRKTFGSDD